MEYNTTRSDLILREYGRNFHKLIDYIGKIKNKEDRNNKAKTIVEMMKLTHPSFKDQNEIDAKMWDDLFIMSDHNLDIDSPFPKPKRKSDSEKPKRLEYPKSNIKYRHYGKKIELLIEEACKIKNDKDKEAAVIHIGKIMKSFFGMWNKESIDSKVIVDHIKELSNNKLSIEVEKVKEMNLFFKVTKERGSKSYHSKKNFKSNRPFKKRRL